MPPSSLLGTREERWPNGGLLPGFLGTLASTFVQKPRRFLVRLLAGSSGHSQRVHLFFPSGQEAAVVCETQAFNVHHAQDQADLPVGVKMIEKCR